MASGPHLVSEPHSKMTQWKRQGSLSPSPRSHPRSLRRILLVETTTHRFRFRGWGNKPRPSGRSVTVTGQRGVATGSEESRRLLRAPPHRTMHPLENLRDAVDRPQHLGIRTCRVRVQPWGLHTPFFWPPMHPFHTWAAGRPKLNACFVVVSPVGDGPSFHCHVTKSPHTQWYSSTALLGSESASQEPRQDRGGMSRLLVSSSPSLGPQLGTREG